MKLKDVTKLPKWAQSEIERLTSDVRYWRTKAEVGPENSNTFVRQSGDGRPLGSNPSIEFKVSDHLILVARIAGQHLVVHCSTGQTVSIVPSAANAFSVTTGIYPHELPRG